MPSIRIICLNHVEAFLSSKAVLSYMINKRSEIIINVSPGTANMVFFNLSVLLYEFGLLVCIKILQMKEISFFVIIPEFLK
jgi:hypothetical protein